MPGPAASLTALPLMLDITTFISTVTWPMPPRKRPTSRSAALQMRSLMVAAFITLPAKMNMGTASSTYMLNMELSVWSTNSPRSCPFIQR